MDEVVGFLGAHAPFSALDGDELERLAALAEAVEVDTGDVLVADGSGPLEHMWVIRSGSLTVLDRGRVVDELGPGETVGHLSLLAGVPPALAVTVPEPTVCYRLPDPRPVLRHPDRLRFTGYGTLVARQSLTRGSGLPEKAHRPVGAYLRPVLWATAAEPVRAVAARMGEERLSCALVELPGGLGIVTDQDFRRRVGTGEVGVDEPVARLASTPVLTVAEGTTVATAFLAMVEHGVHHLVATDAGGRPAGVLRVVDLAGADVRDPLLVRAAVDSATTLDELAEACRLLPSTAVELWDTGVPAPHVGALLAAVLDAVLRRLLVLDAAVADAGVPTSWVVLGSLARGEVLPSSDVDTALVWDDAGDDLDEPGRTAVVRAAARRVLDDVERCGLRTCDSGANADDPRFGRSASRWREVARGWLQDVAGEGALLLSTMLADSRAVTAPALGRAVTEQLTRVRPSPQFRYALTEYTLSARPPTGFVRDFVVEHSGEHRGQLNLKAGGLRPVTSIGRWVAVLTGDTSGSTSRRLRRATEAGLLSVDEVDSLVAAFEQVFSLLLEREVAAIRAGTAPTTYVDPRELDTLTRRHLRESFRAVAHIQSRMEAERALRLV